MNELNPDHPVVQILHDHWHKIVAILMHKLKTDHEVITIQDIESMDEGMFVAVQELSDGMHLRLVNEVTAKEMLEREKERLAEEKNEPDH